MLLEVSLAMQERESDQGDAEVGGGAQGVSGQHAQAARVGGHGRVNGDLHGEVGDKPVMGKVFVGKRLIVVACMGH